jgi:hypothetical protein
MRCKGRKLKILCDDVVRENVKILSNFLTKSHVSDVNREAFSMLFLGKINNPWRQMLISNVHLPKKLLIKHSGIKRPAGSMKTEFCYKNFKINNRKNDGGCFRSGSERIHRWTFFLAFRQLFFFFFLHQWNSENLFLCRRCSYKIRLSNSINQNN